MREQKSREFCKFFVNFPWKIKAFQLSELKNDFSLCQFVGFEVDFAFEFGVLCES